jgi:hypothetical protein
MPTLPQLSELDSPPSKEELLDAGSTLKEAQVRRKVQYPSGAYHLGVFRVLKLMVQMWKDGKVVGN